MVVRMMGCDVEGGGLLVQMRTVVCEVEDRGGFPHKILRSRVLMSMCQ